MDRGRWKLDKSERMQLKALACILGIILLVILLITRWLLSLQEEEVPVPVPVITNLQNVWIMEVEDNGLVVFQEGEKVIYPYGTIISTVDDKQQEIPYQVPKENREQVADITLTDGCITQVVVKNEKINGKILSASTDSVELEGLGRIPISQEARGYRLYDTLSMCEITDLLMGYDFTDFVIENGEICAFLMAKEEAMEYIRVMLKSASYGGNLHESVTLTCDTEYTIVYGSYDNQAQELHNAGEVVTIDPSSTYFQGERIQIIPSVLTGRITLSNVTRSQGEPSYRGTIELLKTTEGMAVINEVLLEEYLYCVVPSEMPASYPAEALKAQAVCARTYAYTHMLKAAYPQYGAHVDDSTSYQVYNNILEQEPTTTAVKDTYGQLLYTEDGRLAGTYYYSTSCGLGSDATVWKSGSQEDFSYLKARAINQASMEQVLAREQTENENHDETVPDNTDDSNNTALNTTDSQAVSSSGVVQDLDRISQAMCNEETFAAFIKGKSADDFEVTEGWYRWTYSVSEVNTAHMLEALQKRYAANEKLILTLEEGEFVSKPITKLGKLTDLYVAKRGSGGIAEDLHIVTDSQTIKVITEHNIRYVLNDGKTKILRQDGSEIASPNLLPSAFFVLDASKEKENVVGYTLTGGGYGHGVGMSQNGARSMAKEGYTAENILKFFYENCTLHNVYEPETVQE